MHGDGNGGNGAEGARPTFEQALHELGPPRDRIDQLIIFCAQQGHDLAGAIDAQAQALLQRLADLMTAQAKTIGNLAELQAKTTGDALSILTAKISDLEHEIVALRGSQAAAERGSLQ
jgi:hypothetical protein